MIVRMAVLGAALDIWQNGGQVVVIGAAGVGIRVTIRVAGDVERHDRRTRDLGEDLRRWLADRDRQLSAELALIAAYANDPSLDGPPLQGLIGGLQKPVPRELADLPAGSQYYSGAHRSWQKAAKERALRAWRDEATRKLRQQEEVAAAEGWVHAIRRRRHGLAELRLRITLESAEILSRWRAPAHIPGTMDTTEIDDPTSPGREPRISELEATAAIV